VQIKLIPEGSVKGKVYLIGIDIVPKIFPLRVNFPVFSHCSWLFDSIVNKDISWIYWTLGIVLGILASDLITCVVAISFGVVVAIGQFGYCKDSISWMQHWFVALVRVISF